jgi:hypothetical protein
MAAIGSARPPPATRAHIVSTNPYQSPNAFTDKYQAPNLQPQLPVSAIVFGILNLVMGGLTLCGTAASSIAFFMPTTPEALEMNPALKIMHETRWFFVYNVVLAGLSFVAGIALLIAGLGLLTQKPYGRYLSIGYAWYAIIMGIVGLLVNVLLFFPAMYEAIERAPEGPVKAGATIGLIAGAIGSMVGFVYPTLLLIFMNRAVLIAAFRRASELDRRF